MRITKTIKRCAEVDPCDLRVHLYYSQPHEPEEGEERAPRELWARVTWECDGETEGRDVRVEDAAGAEGRDALAAIVQSLAGAAVRAAGYEPEEGDR